MPESRLLKFSSDSFVFIETEKGVTKEKRVSATAVRSAFSNIPVDSGYLTPNVFRWGSSVRGEWAMMTIKEHRRKVLIERKRGAVSFRLSLPNLLFAFRGNSWFLFALQPYAVLSDSVRVFDAPFPNVHADGNICWGNNNAPKGRVANMETAFNLFFDAPFNDDLADDKSKSFKVNVNDLLIALSKRKAAQKFPYSELIYNTTLGSLIKDFGGNNDWL